MRCAVLTPCSLQFARLYPLNQRDFPLERKPLDFGPLMPRSVKIENPSRDYTPPSKAPLCPGSLLSQACIDESDQVVLQSTSHCSSQTWAC